MFEEKGFARISPDKDILTLRVRVPVKAPADLKKRIMSDARREIGRRIYDMLQRHRSKVEIELIESVERISFVEEEITLNIVITELEHNVVTFVPSVPNYKKVNETIFGKIDKHLRRVHYERKEHWGVFSRKDYDF